MIASTGILYVCVNYLGVYVYLAQFGGITSSTIINLIGYRDFLLKDYIMLQVLSTFSFSSTLSKMSSRFNWLDRRRIISYRDSIPPTYFYGRECSS